MSNPETTTDDTGAEPGNVTAAPAATTRAPKIRSTLDIKGGAVVIEGEVYGLASIPQLMRDYLALVGLRTRLVAADDRPALFAEFVAGKVPSHTPAPERVSPWYQAMVTALVEETKKSPEPLTEEAASGIVKAMTRLQQVAARKEPSVLKHYRKLTGAKGGLMDLVKSTSEPERSAA